MQCWSRLHIFTMIPSPCPCQKYLFYWVCGQGKPIAAVKAVETGTEATCSRNTMSWFNRRLLNVTDWCQTRLSLRKTPQHAGNTAGCDRGVCTPGSRAWGSPRKSGTCKKECLPHPKSPYTFPTGWGTTTDLALSQQGLESLWQQRGSRDKTHRMTSHGAAAVKAASKGCSAEIPTWFCNFLWVKMYRAWSRAGLALLRSLSKNT